MIAVLTFDIYKGVDLQNLTIDDLFKIVANVIDILLMIIAILAVAYVIYSGIQYITSTGDPSKTAAAKTSLTNAIIGVVLSSSAFLLISFIARQFG